MFVDRVRLTLRAGKGGNGVVAWRRERYIPKGGPCGGNGGRGGSIFIRASTHHHSLERYTNKRIQAAENGQSGASNRRQGRVGKHLVLDVPPGTLVKDAHTGEVLFDIDTPEKPILLCEGGRGGIGNHFFKSSTRQAPNFCTPGKPGQELTVELELKLLADIGLVGFPNAGKSTLFSSLTTIPTKAADYPFTTLHPKLSYMACPDNTRLYIADIPGIIKDAHQDRGLGLEFLRHIERTKFLIFVIDISADNPLQDYQTLRHEVTSYKSELAEKPHLILLNKIDLLTTTDPIDTFKTHITDTPIFPISAYTGDNLEAVIDTLKPTHARNPSTLTTPSYD